MAKSRFQAGKTRSNNRVRRRLVVLLSICIMLVSAYALFEMRIRPALLSAATALAQQAATQAMNQAMAQVLHEDVLQTKQFVEMDVDRSTDLRVIHFNLDEIALVQSDATSYVDQSLLNMKHESFSLPLGQVIGGTLLSWTSIHVPVHVYLLGASHSQIATETKSVGINQTAHFVYLNLYVKIRVVAPLIVSPVEIHSTYPLAYVVLVGRVPSTFVGGEYGSSIPVLPSAPKP